MYGVLQASVATDLKRLLGYSTIENMGLVTLGLGRPRCCRRPVPARRPSSR
ncbi:NADH-Ubiquinone/plastoquinone (complex I), various chains family protein [Mycobacterium ulcerans str. Harvey]|uniref:NADH-Ubiquinone/plastoquinone (Complex I), various chains family protein n=1 Tax=Mycobacterium ulcerans str. Harvey TaxID=1299332 RepID=A0ABN0R0Q4_MYCUL|nr:NADH-Ubiquinone/plastoquinone (complex I), various chains family protein [Mycobacterium ulcerans str. Harvey]